LKQLDIFCPPFHHHDRLLSQLVQPAFALMAQEDIARTLEEDPPQKNKKIETYALFSRASSSPGTSPAPAGTVRLALAKSWPMGWKLPPRCAARNASAMA